MQELKLLIPISPSCLKMSEINVRKACPETDAAAVQAIYAPYVEKTAITFELSAPDVMTMRERMLRTQKRYPYLIAELDHGCDGRRIVGYAYLSPFKERAAYDYSAETSIYVREDCRGMQIGRTLYQALEQAAQAMGLINLYACIAYDRTDGQDPCLNNASVHFHERMSYRLCGRFQRCGYKFGRWYDMVWMEKLLSGHPDHPLPLKPFPEVQLTPRSR